ncbi:hypothetical protein CLV91_2458 [Maribacter vaceletii]|uniref:Uncharacterized protein n=1 Tax=Maribacter vaceletii TaxID=1206816 RepID=A0A495E5W7_9FLAO|nr:hypothetical protein [Maribacter vaceletii]RKR12332.1 hypothetical protein CLV91_2458 [Maribacter vaceletii]
MKYSYFILLTIILCLFSSFKPSKPCEYAGSNIGFVKTETQKAIKKNDINVARYHAYKAIKAIEKTKDQLNNCGCDYAATSIEDSFKDLVLATRATTLRSTKILLNRSLEKTIGSLEALEKHELHNSDYASDVLAVNTIGVSKKNKSLAAPKGILLEKKIDSTLFAYEKSLQKIVETVDCKKALHYATQIFEHCEQQLLKPNLSEGKKYYNLRTKEITANAIEQLNNCN